MNTDWMAGGIAVLGVIGSISGARFASLSTVRAAKVSADEGAFIRAKDIYDAGQKELEERIERLGEDQKDTRKQLGETVRELAETRRELKAARAEIGTLRRSVSQYEGRVIQLEVVLRMHNIEVPPWTLMPSDMGLLPGSIPDPNQPPFTTEFDT